MMNGLTGGSAANPKEVTTKAPFEACSTESAVLNNGKCLSVLVGDPIERFLKSRPRKINPVSMGREYGRSFSCIGDEDRQISESTALNRLVERYEYFLKANFPNLSQQAWEAVLNAYNGMTENELQEIDYFFSDVMDDLGIEDVKKAPVFVKELVGLTPSQTLVVFEVIERFWGRSSFAEDKMNEVLVEVSGRHDFCLSNHSV
jgi:hypothetical protein